MSTQDIVETFIQKHRSEAHDEGRDEGRTEGRAEAVIEVYTDRFGAPPAEMVAVVAQTHDRAVLRGWLKLSATAPAEEVLTAIVGQANGNGHAKGNGHAA